MPYLGRPTYKKTTINCSISVFGGQGSYYCYNISSGLRKIRWYAYTADASLPPVATCRSLNHIV